MWIGSTRHSKSKPFQIKWTDEPIKALGVYFTYHIKLLHEKNFLEKLDSIKKLINNWSSRGLSIYGKVTVVKSFFANSKICLCIVLTSDPQGIGKGFK